LALSLKIDKYAAPLRQANPNRLLRIVDELSSVADSIEEKPLRTTSYSPSLFPYEAWESKLEDLAAEYQSNPPFPNIHLANFLRDETARKAMAEFPKPGDTTWIHYKHFNENTMGKGKRAEFPALLGALVDEFNTARFARFLSKLSGIPNLVADPILEGGGMHQTKSGGFLNVHADFNMHHYHPNWRRRCNLILYLNEDWKPEWGEALELWDTEVIASRGVEETEKTINPRPEPWPNADRPMRGH
jgi:hypothetical protein